MFVVWRRPDGFHESRPEDFYVVAVGSHLKLWLHKKDTLWYPFRITGGWQESEATKRLNGLVNLLTKGEDKHLDYLVHEFHHSLTEDPALFLKDTISWVKDLQNHLKGDHWEVEMMKIALEEVQQNLLNTQQRFIEKIKS